MTNGWIDMKNADMLLIMGGNPAENHPCGFKWVVEAKRNRDARVIVVDPRFTRTASQADLFCQIRAGSDIAFLGGLINYAIEHNRVNHEYLVNYTNAAFLIKDGFKLPEDGLFSGFNPETKTYDQSTWNYEAGGNETGKFVAVPVPGTAGDVPGGAAAGSTGSGKQDQSHGKVPSAKEGTNTHQGPEGQGYQAEGPVGAKAMGGVPASLPPNVAYDTSLQHPRCVYQLLKKAVLALHAGDGGRITGIPQDQFLKAADLFTSIRKNGDTKQGGDHHLRGRAGRSTASARRSSAPRRCCSC